jgi:hypothetical protein
MKKCYIAGKIGNLPVHDYTENFNNAEKEVTDLGYFPISPIFLEHNHDKSWQSYMKEDIRALTLCDAVYCLRNWRDSQGATIEIELALKLGIKIIFQK